MVRNLVSNSQIKISPTFVKTHKNHGLVACTKWKENQRIGGKKCEQHKGESCKAYSCISFSPMIEQQQIHFESPLKTWSWNLSGLPKLVNHLTWRPNVKLQNSNKVFNAYKCAHV